MKENEKKSMKFVDTKTGVIYEIVYDDYEKKYCIHYYHPRDRYGRDGKR